MEQKLNKNPIYIDNSKTAKVYIFTNDDGSVFARAQDVCGSKYIKNYIANVNKALSVVLNGENFDVYLNQTKFAQLSKEKGSVKIFNILTAFEQKISSHKNSVFVLNPPSKDIKTKTDLHTHFTGVLSAERLIKLGLKYDIKIPNAHIKMLGFEKLQSKTNNYVSLKKLFKKSSEFKKKYEENLSVSVHRQEVFCRMDKIYDYRRIYSSAIDCTDPKNCPIAPNKQEKYFKDFLTQMAIQNKQAGVGYSEISLTNIHSERFIALLEKYVPIVEQETSVSLRFLASVVRTAPKQLQKDFAKTAIRLSQSPIFAGFDILGHEVNSTKDFAFLIEQIAEHAMLNDPSLCVRVHAGESGIFANNAIDVLRIIKSKKHQLQEKNPNVKITYPEIRIGHGIRGASQEFINLTKETGAIIEINLSSNLSLNNINDATEVPVRKYLDAGCKLVLGTDSGGVYHTNILDEAKIFLASGGTAEDLKKIAALENKLLNKKQAAFAAKQKTFLQKFFKGNKKIFPFNKIDLNEFILHYRKQYKIKEKEKEFTKKVSEFYSAQMLNDVEEMKQAFKGNKVNFSEEVLREKIKDRIPFYIAGETLSALEDIGEQSRQNIKQHIVSLLTSLDPSKFYLVMTGKNNAISKYAANVAAKLNLQNNAQIPIVAYAARSMKDAIKTAPPNVTDFIIPKTDGWNYAENEFGLVETITDAVAQKNGYCIAIGGGSFLGDVVQIMHQKNANLFLSSEFGISKTKCEFFKGQDIDFKNTGELLSKIYKKDQTLFKETINILKKKEGIKHD